MSSFSTSLPKDKLLKASSEHKFIQSISNGQVTEQQVNTWLAQDYLFLINYRPFNAHLMRVAPPSDQSVLNGTTSAIDEEAVWFEKNMKERGIATNGIKALPANLAYQQWMNELIKTERSYLSLITAVYGMGLCYYQAWKSVKNPDYQKFVSFLGSETFGKFVEELRACVDRAGTTASEDDKKDARQLWDDVMRLESDFWDMAINNPSS